MFVCSWLTQPPFFYFQPFNCQCSCTMFITSKPAKSSITGAIFQTRRNFFAIKMRENISRECHHTIAEEDEEEEAKRDDDAKL